VCVLFDNRDGLAVPKAGVGGMTIEAHPKRNSDGLKCCYVETDPFCESAIDEILARCRRRRAARVACGAGENIALESATPKLYAARKHAGLTDTRTHCISGRIPPRFEKQHIPTPRYDAAGIDVGTPSTSVAGLWSSSNGLPEEMTWSLVSSAMFRMEIDARHRLAMTKLTRGDSKGPVTRQT